MKKVRKSGIRFAMCIKNHGYESSLEIGKLYRVIPDQQAKRHGYLRVVDESGEDYGYAANRFFDIEVPKQLENMLLEADRGMSVADALRGGDRHAENSACRRTSPSRARTPHRR